MVTHAPPADTRDPKALRLYQAIGYFIARWSLVEELMYVIYFRASNLPETMCAEEFFAIDSYVIRQKFTKFAVRAKFRKDRKKREYWEAKLNNLNDFFAFRNFIGHNPVHEPQLSIDFTVMRALVTKDYIVSSHFHQPRKKKLIYTFQDIAKKAKALDKVIADLRKEIFADFPEEGQPAQKTG